MELQGGEKPITEESTFDVLLIKPNNIQHLDYNNVSYISDIINMNCLEIISTDSSKIAHVFADNLNPKNIDDCIAVTNICYETIDKIYEICFLDVPKEHKTKENLNDIATMLDITEEKIYGNAILLRTNLPLENYSMKLIDSSKESIKTILDARVNHKGVFIGDDNEMKEMNFRDINTKLKELFGDINDVTKYEIPFLKHNFTMYYIKNSYENENKIVKNISESTIYGDVFITSMLTNKMFTDITITEVEKMLVISKYGSDMWTSKTSDDNIEKDSMDRNIIKSKFRILHNKYQEVLKMDQLNVD